MLTTAYLPYPSCTHYPHFYPFAGVQDQRLDTQKRFTYSQHFYSILQHFYSILQHFYSILQHFHRIFTAFSPHIYSFDTNIPSISFTSLFGIFEPTNSVALTPTSTNFSRNTSVFILLSTRIDILDSISLHTAIEPLTSRLLATTPPLTGATTSPTTFPVA